MEMHAVTTDAHHTASVRVGIDTGGTFVDVVVAGEDHVEVFKFPSAYSDAQGATNLREALLSAAHDGGFGLGQIDMLRFGTTLAINTILQRKLAKTAVLTTQGYRDALELLRQSAPPYALEGERITPIVPRALRREVNERLDAHGQIVEPLDVSSAVATLTDLQQQGVAAVAISLLFSYLNSEHEEILAKLVQQYLPDAACTVSSKLAPELGETERTLTAAVNAGLMPIMQRYLDGFHALQHEGLTCPTFIMQSSGGVLSQELASERPVTTVMSGPTAGVIAAGTIATQLNRPRVISMDIGGTSCDVALITDGHVPVSPRGVLPGFPPFSPINVAMTDIASIAMGGGSIAWVDVLGVLHVGPESQGSQPGPACYRRGGTRATLTDAFAVLGVLGSTQKLGGKISLDVGLARDALAREVAQPLGIGVEEAALGVIRLAAATIADELQLVSVGKGVDPREFTLLAFGGAGPALAVAVAEQLGMTEVIIPRYPGALSAYGLLLADVRHDYARSFVVDVATADIDAIESIFADLQKSAEADLVKENIPTAQARFERTIDMRYKGQLFTLTIESSASVMTLSELDQLTEAFHEQHQVVYGYSAPEEQVQLVTMRLRCLYRPAFTASIAEALRAAADGSKASAEAASVRSVYFAEQGWVSADVLQRAALRPGQSISGPVVVEQADATTVIPSGFMGTIDEWQNLCIAAGE